MISCHFSLTRIFKNLASGKTIIPEVQSNDFKRHIYSPSWRLLDVVGHIIKDFLSGCDLLQQIRMSRKPLMVEQMAFDQIAYQDCAIQGFMLMKLVKHDASASGQVLLMNAEGGTDGSNTLLEPTIPCRFQGGSDVIGDEFLFEIVLLDEADFEALFILDPVSIFVNVAKDRLHAGLGG